ncbi:unnamed protein product, partial [Prorocentrum cordatum]
APTAASKGAAERTKPQEAELLERCRALEAERDGLRAELDRRSRSQLDQGSKQAELRPRGGAGAAVAVADVEAGDCGRDDEEEGKVRGADWPLQWCAQRLASSALYQRVFFSYLFLLHLIVMFANRRL